VADVFISYNHPDEAEAARAVQAALGRRNLRSFPDVDAPQPDQFSGAIAEEIAKAASVVVILTPGALSRLSDENNRLRHELGCALGLNKRAVIILKDGIFIPPARDLPRDLAGLPALRTVAWSQPYLDAMIDTVLALPAKSGEASRVPRRPRIAFDRRLAILLAIAILVIELGVIACLIARRVLNTAAPNERGGVRGPAVLVWGGKGQTVASGVCVDESGCVYTVGCFYGTASLDPAGQADEFRPHGDSDAYLSKLGPSGEFLWATTWGGFEDQTGGDSALGVATDSGGNIYVVGRIIGSGELDPGPGTCKVTPDETVGSYLIKLDSSGRLLDHIVWQSSELRVNGIALDSAGNIYLAADFSRDVDFDPGPSVADHTSQENDAALIMLDPSFTYKWGMCWGGSENDYAESVCLDRSGNTYVTGSFEGSADFDPGVGEETHQAVGDSDAYVSKFDSSLAHHWAGTWGGEDWDEAFGVAADRSGSIFIVGRFDGTTDLCPGPRTRQFTSQGDLDSYLLKLDSNGSFKWALNWGAADFEDANGVCSVDPGRVYVAGSFRGTTDLDPGRGVLERAAQGESSGYLIVVTGNGNLIRW